MSKKKNRPHGHYCKICGEYKANEKFSGKGHAAHICKACSRLSAAEKAAAMDINRLMNFPMRRLSEGEKKWLKAKMKDDCPEVADRRFTIDRKSCVLTMTDFHTGGVEHSVTPEGGQMAKLLRYIVHTLEIFMWEQDYSLRPDEGDYDPFLDEEDFFMEDLGDGLEVQPQRSRRMKLFHL